MAISEEEKYQRKTNLLTRALAEADKLDAKDKEKEAAASEKEKAARARKRQESAAQREKDGKKAEQDAEPVID